MVGIERAVLIAGVEMAVLIAGVEMESRSKGVNARWESQQRMIYFSSQIMGRALAESDGLSHDSKASSIGSRRSGSFLKNREITFDPLTLQKVYKILQIAEGSGSTWVFGFVRWLVWFWT